MLADKIISLAAAASRRRTKSSLIGRSGIAARPARNQAKARAGLQHRAERAHLVALGRRSRDRGAGLGRGGDGHRRLELGQVHSQLLAHRHLPASRMLSQFAHNGHISLASKKPRCLPISIASRSPCNNASNEPRQSLHSPHMSQEIPLLHMHVAGAHCGEDAPWLTCLLTHQAHCSMPCRWHSFTTAVDRTSLL